MPRLDVHKQTRTAPAIKNRWITSARFGSFWLALLLACGKPRRNTLLRVISGPNPPIPGKLVSEPLPGVKWDAGELLDAASMPLGIGSKLLKGLEARAGIEPAHEGFADLLLSRATPYLSTISFEE